MKNIKITELSDVIEDILSEYGDKALDVINEETEKLGKVAVKELKKKSPKLTGSYAKGWKVKTYRTRLGAGAVAYNKTNYQLTHLLEHGHLNRKGTKQVGKAPHIADVNDEIQDKFVKAVMEGLQK